MSETAISKNEVVIFNEYTMSDTVDMGMCMPGNNLFTIFNLRNLTGQRLRMIGLKPSFATLELPEHPGQQFEFEPATAFPLDVPPNSLEKLYLRFNARAISSQPPRKNTIKLQLSLFNPDSTSFPDTTNVKGLRDFIVIARKTIHNIDVFEELISFDSVYVYPNDTVRKKLIVQNSYTKPLKIFKAKYERSLNAEITATIMKMPLAFEPYKEEGFQHTWDFAYYPRNMGLDTAILSLSFKPDPELYPDSVETVKTRIHAVGVQQDLGIIKADSAVSFAFNRLNFGDIDVGKSKTIKFVVRTIGNIPFGALSQKLLKFDSGAPAEGFTLERKMVDTLDLQPYMTDTLVVKFTPTRSDTFRVRLVIESNIINRNIIGYPDSVRYRTFILEGVGRQAEIASMPDEINFGNIVVNETGDCPTRRDTLIPVSNIGNMSLLVHSRVLPDNSRNPFKVKPGFITIPGRQTKYILVSFDSTIKKPGYYYADLYFVSNSPEEKDTLISKLVARGVYPDTMDISIPKNLHNKPGRRISVPVLIDKNKASISRIFTDTITYNKSLLYFHASRKNGTAAEFCEVTAIQSEENGALFLKIQTLGSERFLSRDTLIVLEFDTYLGSTKSTPLHFVNPKFSDGICAQILSLNRLDGLFRLDSVCGLDMKTGKQYFNGIRFKMLAPNPATDNVRIAFELDGEYNVELYMFNSYGEKIATLMNESMKKGIYQREFELNDLPAGVYFIEARAGIYRKTEQLIILY